jgi:hypothetical protein
MEQKIKPVIDHNYSLLWHVTHLKMIDWMNTDGFKDLPLLPSTFEYPLLENNMGEGKPLSLLLHITGASFYHEKLSKITRLSVAG